jgi:hypothetical protein
MTDRPECERASACPWTAATVAFATVVLGLNLFYLGLFAPIPRESQLGSETSPDGSLIAEYSWRPTGLVGWWIGGKANPTFYLTIRDSRTRTVVSRESYLGDGASLDEAKDHFADRLPWKSRVRD